MTKILVTGALGTIGKPMVQRLEKKYDVISTDIMLEDKPNYYRADVTQFEDLHEIFRLEEIDTVIHMAGEVGRIVGERHPQRMLHTNCTGTMNIVKLCMEHNTRLMYFSTSEVYGSLFNKMEPVNESMELSTMNVTNIYAMSKLMGESLVKHYIKNYNLNALTVRPFMIYGPGEQPKSTRSALINFVYNALTNKELTVHSGTSRAWCYIDDFIDGIEILLKQQQQKTYEAFNVGSNEYHPIAVMALMIIEELKKDSQQIKLIKSPIKFMSKNKNFSIKKMQKLGYEPKVSLEEGLSKVINAAQLQLGR